VSDAFGIMVGCAGFVLGVGYGLFLGRPNPTPAKKGKPVSDRRMRQLHVIDPLLERGPLLEHQFPTISPKEHT
jgi:hypothetical protein